MDNKGLKTQIGEHSLKPVGCTQFCSIDRQFCPLFCVRNKMNRQSGWWSGTTSNEANGDVPEYKPAPRAFPLGPTP